MVSLLEAKASFLSAGDVLHRLQHRKSFASFRLFEADQLAEAMLPQVSPWDKMSKATVTETAVGGLNDNIACVHFETTNIALRGMQ